MLNRFFGEPDPQKAHAKGAARDAAQLATFRQLGTDMTELRPVDHNFFVGSERDATILAGRLAELATNIKISRVLRCWGVECVVVMPLSDVAVAEQRAKFEALAVETGASYDGWGALAGPSD